MDDVYLEDIAGRRITVVKVNQKSSPEGTDKMTTLRDCLYEVIAKGSGLFVRSYAIPGAYRRTEWEPDEFLAELLRESPGVLGDGAWGEWVTRPGMGLTFFIHYGQQGFSLSHREVPGYGHLRVLEVSQRYAQDTILSNVGRPGRF